MQITYKFRLYPNREQEALILRTFDCCRYVHNHLKAERAKQRELAEKSPDTFSRSRQLSALKQEHPWLYEADATALQAPLGNRQSYRSKSPCIHVFEDAVQLPKLGRVKCHVSQPVQGRILSAIVSQSGSGKFFVSLHCTGVEPVPLPTTGRAIEISRGKSVFAVSSDGTVYPNDPALLRNEKKLARLRQQLARKEKGSKREEKAERRLARFAERTKNQRQDMLHKLSTQLVRDYDVIRVRDRRSREPRSAVQSAADAAWEEFLRQMEYKAAWYGKEVVVNRSR